MADHVLRNDKAKITTHEVEEVAALVGGRSIVFIGGHRRPESEQVLKEAFNLQDVIWIATKKHESVKRFEAQIARPDVAVVALLTRLSSHSFSGVREFCDRHAKPLVWLPGGYNKNAVAAQIMDQCSQRLRAGRTRPRRGSR